MRLFLLITRREMLKTVQNFLRKFFRFCPLSATPSHPGRASSVQNAFLASRGETIAETVIALTVLAIGISLSSVLMANSLKNINTSKERVIATNIAREGIEAVRNVRDTNWLKFSGKRRDCWNHMPKQLAADDCNTSDPANLIEPGTYVVYMDEDFRWRLKEVVQPQNQKRWLPTELNLPTAIVPPDFDASRLYTMDIDPLVDSDGDCNAVPRPANCLADDADIYNPKIHPQSLPTDPLNYPNDVLGRGYAQPTLFNRLITIDYLTNTGESITSTTTDLGIAHNRMLVTSGVTWAGLLKGVELKTIFTDYYGRENLTN